MSETVKDLIERYIAEAAQPGSRPIIGSHMYSLKQLMRMKIAEKLHDELKAVDFLDHCKARIAAGVKPQTVNQDVIYLSGILKYAFEVWELSENGYKAYKRAKKQLFKQQLIGKSQRRTRRPTEDEIERLLEYFCDQDANPHTTIPMATICEFQILTARRISETCRLRWGDVDFEKKTCLVRDLKNPKGKGYHDTFPLLGRAWEIVMAQPRKTNDPNERIFPYSSKSCSIRYTQAKKVLGIENLHLHDSRREAISRLFEEGYNVPEVAKMSLHRNPSLLLMVYTNLKPEDLHKGPASKRVQP